MIRKTQYRTTKQALFLQSVTNQLKDMDDPDIITYDSYVYHETNLKGIGTIPKITFKPYGKSTQIKAEIMRKANLDDRSKQKKIAEIRTKFGLTTARDTETRILARLFESHWSNYWRGIRTALNRIEQAQKLFITNTEGNETISKPMRIMMGNKAVVGNETKEEKNMKSKSYMDELMELD